MSAEVWNVIAPMVVGIFFMAAIAGVILLRPIVVPLGELLRAMTEERRERGGARELQQVREVLLTVEGRLSLLEERQRFTEALLEPSSRARVVAGDEGAARV